MNAGAGECDLLFVYGTLRRDSAHPMARYLERVARYLGDATVAGRLYDLGRYPGLVGGGPGERVRGHQFAMDDPAAVLARLDEYEGCPLGEPGPSFFERGLTEALTADGQTRTAWVYTYQGPLTTAKWIESGEYTIG